MLNFVQKSFRTVFVVLLWIITIGLAIGIVIAVGVFAISIDFGDKDVMLRTFGLVVGGVIGFLIGFLIVIIFGGLVATFLDMNENLRVLVEQTKPTAIGANGGETNKTWKAEEFVGAGH